MKIDKNIPIPTTREHKYPYKVMEIGDSVALQTRNQARAMVNSNYIWAKRLKLTNRLVSKKVTENKKEIYRVWRRK
jgi:hypothetical protein